MKKLILVSLLFGANLASAVELVSFESVREQFKKSKDETRISYLLFRCAALQLNVASLLLKGGDAATSSNYQKSAEFYMQLAGAMEEAIDKKRGVANSDPANNVVVAVKQIATIYTQKLNENYAQRGEYLVGDKQLERELTECNNSERFLLLIIEK